MALLYFRGRLCAKHVPNLRVHTFLDAVVPCPVLHGIVYAHRDLLFVNHKLTVNVMTYVFVCRVMTSGVNLTTTETVSPTWRWCVSSPYGWKFSGSLLNQYLIEDLKSLPQSQEKLPSWRRDPLVYSDCLANLFSFRFATATVFFLTNLWQTHLTFGWKPGCKTCKLTQNHRQEKGWCLTTPITA